MSRSHGYSLDDLIENPVLIAESLERDEIRCERDLIIDSVSTADIEFSTTTPLVSTVDDYYNGAILVNVTMSERYTVSDYNGSTQVLTLSSTPSGWSASDKCYLKNINCNVDTTTVDATAADRDSWIFGRSLTDRKSSDQIFQQLMFESHCIRFKTYNNTSIVTLDLDESVGTLDTPLIENGRPQVSWTFTPLNNIYSSFVLNYDYDPASNLYRKHAKVDKNYASDAYLDGMKTYCSNAEINYKIGHREYTYDSDWIYDDATAYYLLEKLVLWFSYQRMVLTWSSNIKEGIKYEVGDKVLVDYDYMIPDGRSGTQVFLITYKKIMPKKKVVLFNLIY